MRNKIIFSLLACAFILASCADKNAYTISATFSGRAETKDSTKVYLYQDPRGIVALDSTVLIGGKFVIKGSQEKPVMAYVGMLVADQYPMMMPIILESGNITVDMSEKISVTGTPLNDLMKSENDLVEQKFKDLNKAYNEGIAAVNDEEEQQALEKTIEEGQQRIIDELVVFIKANIDNPVGTHFFINTAEMIAPEQQKEIIDAMSEEVKANEFVSHIAQQVEVLTQTEVGKKFVDVKGLTLDGKEASLSDYAGKGKIVLVDFWASWCGPCIRELPSVKKAYNAYKDKGFEIVGISLDMEKEAWQEATTKHGVVWPQFSTLQGWDEPAARIYGVSSIPFTLLLDKDGTILEKNLRGEAIEKRLKELLD